MANDLISLHRVSFSYPNGRCVFKDLSFCFNDKQRLGLVGSNGSGKTTLLKIIMGLLKPQNGEVTLLGENCKTEKNFYSKRMQIGFVFQDADDQLFCPTVGDDIAFGPLNMGKSKQEVQEIVEETLNILGLSDFINRPIFDLSDGEKKLIAIGTALAMKPKMLILDEPTTCLDEEAVARVAQVLLNCELPYLIVSHDRAFLEQVTTERILMPKNIDGINLNMSRLL